MQIQISYCKHLAFATKSDQTQQNFISKKLQFQTHYAVPMISTIIMKNIDIMSTCRMCNLLIKIEKMACIASSKLLG